MNDGDGPYIIPEIEAGVLRLARVARMATADSAGRPHLVPICFVFDGMRLYSALDRKPKRSAPSRLKRVRNILSNSHVAVMVDHYEEEWDRLWYLLVSGTARLAPEGEDRTRAIHLLKEKYPQYRGMDIDEAPVIEISPDGAVSWGNPR